jgi:ferredoxin
MDLLSCQTGSRCSSCHWLTSRGCKLLAELDAFENIDVPAPRAPARLRDREPLITVMAAPQGITA